MPSVRVKENEYFDAALRRFKRACEKAGVLTELRRREYYEKPTQERKRKKAAAVKRHLKKISREEAKRKPPEKDFTLGSQTQAHVLNRMWQALPALLPQFARRNCPISDTPCL